MGRNKKDTVDYFPHYCQHGRTMHSIKRRCGAEGYAFWFCLLELLGNSAGHFIDCNDKNSWIYLVEYSMVADEEKAEEIINFLIDLGALDEKLWKKKKILWSDNFADRLGGLYKRRNDGSLPEKPTLKHKKDDKCIHKSNLGDISDVINPQSKVKESKEKESKRENRPNEEIIQFFIKSILDWKPNWKKPTESILDQWDNDIRKMIDIDKRGRPEIIEVIKWLTQDSFWQRTIFSARNLRKHFDMIQGQMTEPVKKTTVENY